MKPSHIIIAIVVTSVLTAGIVISINKDLLPDSRNRTPAKITASNQPTWPADDTTSKLPTTEADVSEPDVTIGEFLDDFNDAGLKIRSDFSKPPNKHYTIEPESEDTFISGSIPSNSGDRVAYWELDKCLAVMNYFGDLNRPVMPCEHWTYSIKVRNLNDNATKTIYTGTEKDHLAYFPVAWSKNDKKIILTWRNIGQGGTEGPAYNSYGLNPEGGQLENLGNSNGAMFFDSFSKLVTADDVAGISFCSPMGNHGEIKLINVETGASKILLAEKQSFYVLEYLDKVNNTLHYTRQNIVTDQKSGCSSETGEPEKRELKLPNI